MNNKILNEMLLDVNCIRQIAIQSAGEAFKEAANEIFNRQFLSKNGFYIIDNDDGVVRYVYLEDGPGEENALKDIKDNGLIILDESEDDFWYEAIDPEDLMNNNILQELDNESKLKSKYQQFVKVCKKTPWKIDDVNIPSFESWRMGNTI